MTEQDAIAARLRIALPSLRQRWPIRSLALFGSVVRGEARNDSDLDVLVEFDRPIDLFAFLALEDELASLSGRRVGSGFARGTQALHRSADTRGSHPAVTLERDYRDFLQDLVSACRSIIGFVAGMSFDACMADEKTRFAVMRGYEILGEATRHLPSDLKDPNPEIPWVYMAAVRNRIAHGYFGIDDLVLFETIETRLKALLPLLEALAATHGVVK